MDEEIRDWIKKKKKEIEGLEVGSENPPEKSPNTEIQPAEDKTSEPVKVEQPQPAEVEKVQPIEQKTAAETTQSIVPPKSSETAIPLEYKPEEAPEEDQYQPPRTDLNDIESRPSKPPLLTRKSKVLLALIVIWSIIIVLLFLYVIPSISV